MIGALWDEAVFGLRLLRRHPGFAVAVVATMGLGVGADTGIFSVADAVLLQRAPFPRPDELVLVTDAEGVKTMSVAAFSPPEVLDLRALRIFSGLVAYTGLRAVVTGWGDAEIIRGARVTPSFFQVMGVEPSLGRLFGPEEEGRGSDRVVLISHSIWRRHYNRDPHVVGRTLTLDGVGHVIVGVIPQGDQYPAWCEIWTPLSLTARDANEVNRRSRYLMVVGRLRRGFSLEQSRRDADAILRASARERLSSALSNGIGLIPFGRFRTAGVRSPFLVLSGAAGFVLLIACINVANLLLVHATSRRRELAIRLALGATRASVLRLLLVQTVVIGAIGCALGLLVSRWVVQLLLAAQPGDFSVLTGVTAVTVNVRSLGFAAVVAMLASGVCWLVASLEVSPARIQTSLTEEGRASSSGRVGRRVRSGLVVAEVVSAAVLLNGAGVMTRSLLNILSVDPGFDSEGLLALQLPLPAHEYQQPRDRTRVYRRVLGQVQMVPGVQAASLIDPLPLSRFNIGTGFSIEEGEEGGRRGGAGLRTISSSYFSTMRIPLLEGRVFSDEDDAAAPQVVVINRTMSKRYWPNGGALGQRLRIASRPGVSFRIVGVVGDVKHVALDARPEEELYWPYSQSPSSSMWLVARANADPMGLVPALRAAVREVDPDLPIARVATMSQLIRESPSVAPRRTQTALLDAMAALAALLAVIGIYGVVSFSAAQRTQEIGVRRALGASDLEVVRLVVAEAVVLAVVGVCGGLFGSYALNRVLGSLLFNVGPMDIMTLSEVSLLLVGAAAVAGCVPAIRAAEVHPMSALRIE